MRRFFVGVLEGGSIAHHFFDLCRGCKKGKELSFRGWEWASRGARISLLLFTAIGHRLRSESSFLYLNFRCVRSICVGREPDDSSTSRGIG